jgi:DNA-binding CsgD family transcriptional regulator
MAVADHFVGRAAALDSFDHLLAGLGRGESSALEIAGEPGIGKTRLLGELAARADARGYLVLTGFASELEQDSPFCVFVDALDEYVGSLSPALLEHLDDEVRTELATVLPSMSTLGNGRAPAHHHERYRSYRAVGNLLELLARTQPLVIALDDLHWGDPASLELVGSLLRRPPGGSVLLALAMRPRQISDRLSTSIERASRAGTLARIEVPALTAEESRELVGERNSARDLYSVSGGNPFYLEQLARMLDRPNGLPWVGSELAVEAIGVPPPVAAALAEELTLLSDEARRVLDAASVAGDPFEPELAAAAAALPESTVMDALDELLGLDLVRHTDVPRRFRFRHPLLRRAVYENTPGGWRIGAHERTAEALAGRGASATSRAHHVEHSARQGDGAAVATLREAGAASAQHAPASAARWLESALRLLPDTATSEERVELLESRSEALAATGQLVESHAALEESIALISDGAGVVRIRLISACARLEHVLGQHAKARARLESALADLPDSSSTAAATLMIELAIDGMYRMEYGEMPPWAERALETAKRLDEPALTAEALAVCAAAAALSGAAGDGKAYRDAAEELADALSDEELAPRLDGLAHLALAELYLDHFEASGRHAERALAVGRATGQGDLFPTIFPLLGTALWMQGRAAEAGRVLDGAVEGARLLGDVHGLAWNLLHRAEAAFAEGEIDSALAHAEEGGEIARSLGESLLSLAAGLTLARPLLESGQAARAVDVLHAAAGGGKLERVPLSTRPRSLELMTRCLLAAGRAEEAEQAAGSAMACAEITNLPMGSGMANLAAGSIALHAGDPAGAATYALDAATLLEETGDRFDGTMARMFAGRALAFAGDKGGAAAEFERAANVFRSSGSPRYLSEAERELRKLGRHIHHRTRPGEEGGGVESLTAREFEVGRLVVDRKTNPEIAAELFLSKKTVETHLRNIFRKMGVSSRVELARTLQGADRHTPAHDQPR